MTTFFFKYEHSDGTITVEFYSALLALCIDQKNLINISKSTLDRFKWKTEDGKMIPFIKGEMTIYKGIPIKTHEVRKRVNKMNTKIT